MESLKYIADTAQNDADKAMSSIRQALTDGTDTRHNAREIVHAFERSPDNPGRQAIISRIETEILSRVSAENLTDPTDIRLVQLYGRLRYGQVSGRPVSIDGHI